MSDLDIFEFNSPIGVLALSSHEKELYEIDFKKSLSKNSQRATSFQKTCQKQLEEYFAGKRKTFDIPIRFTFGTPFQQKVWQVIANIPFGSTITYTELATAAGRPKAIRAAASACGKNPIPVIIPCHRVLGKSGLGGYTGGLHIKTKLLQLEGIQP